MYKRGTTGPIKSPAGLTDRDFLSKAELKVSAQVNRRGWRGRWKHRGSSLIDGIQWMNRWSHYGHISSFPKGNNYFHNQRVAWVTLLCDKRVVSP